ncbi:formamidopyrimidine-DNA glycosylase [Desulfosporosinus orientis DSM 765]|uniref:Formamidopyrimidine-DNA glycosylase n=1 Tax=Desulfosporosinus orientis (strain ATCC 19365 / DSM 765 / NCIMB 8382 / VKM B-1628 / Singapore I) TaxID=768706 RepID=G7WF39_DESOD|nr:DNA-formamidopyrimidine glycosylase family protein [Desulfosporosinus orientis]AET67650.1 formamidopyrimidine-DNA glycosylase [Desulfosporosinus orientis DSM 765]
MPEIPEMEIYEHYLNQLVKNKKISRVNVLRLKSINLESTVFSSQVMNKQITGIERQGKFLIFHLDDDNYLLTHMMLDGRLFYITNEDINQSMVMQSSAEDLKEMIKDLPGKPSVVFGLDDGSTLFFCNLTLGYLYYLGKDELEKKLQELGRDPLDPSFQAQEFAQLLEGKRGKIKPWLMNPRNISGVGNAYSNEALFQAGILPTRVISAISVEEKQALFRSLVEIINESIRLGGDMEEPFADWDDFTGGYNAHFKVYAREGVPCVNCREPIQKSEVGGRNSYFCPLCQK